MKKILVLFIFFNAFLQAQERPFYEQKAFDFFFEKIVDSFPVERKIRINKYLSDSHIEFMLLNCLEVKEFFKLKNMDSSYNKANSFSSSLVKLDFSNLKKNNFKGKNSIYKVKRRLFISEPFKYNFFIYVNIHEVYSERKSIVYSIKLDKKGNVLNWCREKQELIRIY